MRLVENWKAIATKSHSMWASYLGLLCLIVPEALYFFWNIDTSPRLWWGLGIFLLAYGTVGRLLDQGIGRSKLKGGNRAALLSVLAVALCVGVATQPDWRPMLSGASAHVVDVGPSVAPMPVSDEAFNKEAVPYIGGWEGLRLTPYRDIVGVLTVCYGETQGVEPGDTYTKAECDAMLAVRILEYRHGLHGYLTPETLTQRLPIHRDLAYVDLAYNVGISGAGKSTAVRRLNSGQIAAGCDALTWWNKAGGRVIRGLQVRRGGGYERCMRGVGVT